MKSIRSQLAELSQVASDLNDASDRFTKGLAEVELALAAMNLGIEVTGGPTISEGEVFATPAGDAVQDTSNLMYMREGGTWRIVVAHWNQPVDNPSEGTLIGTTPLLESSRELRLAAAEKLSEFLELIKAEAKASISHINATMPKDQKPLRDDEGVIDG